MFGGIVKDALQVLQIAQLTIFDVTAAAADQLGTAKAIPALPLAAVAVLEPFEAMPAAHTLDVSVLGSDDDGVNDPYVTVATFAQVTTASHAIQRVEIATPKKYYKTKRTSAGAFGSAEHLRAICSIVGTGSVYLPADQV